MNTRRAKLTDPEFDFPEPVSLRKSYLVASNHRNGDAFLCKSLWKSGILGAPWRYLNGVYNRRGNVLQPAENSVMLNMMRRLGSASIADYFSNLLDCRTSGNGIFGMQTGFDEFQDTLDALPEMLEILSPTTFIYVNRRQDLAYAVLVAKAAQKEESAYTIAEDPQGYRPRYDRDLISTWLGRLDRQKLCWWRWFEKNKISPIVLDDDDISVDIGRIVHGVGIHLGVENDELDSVDLPPFAKETYRAEDKWALRFEREIRVGINPQESDSDDTADKYPRKPNELESIADMELSSQKGPTVGNSLPQFKRIETGSSNVRELAGNDGGDPPASELTSDRAYSEPKYLAFEKQGLARYGGIVTGNRELFSNARILELMCTDGSWCFLALDAGAAHVVGVDPRANLVATADKNFAESGIDRSLFQFVHAPILSALAEFTPGLFDLILCRRVLELFDPRILFGQLRRLEPRTVIIDTNITSGAGPISRFVRIDHPQPSAPSAGEPFPIVAIPNHEQLTFFSEYFGFRLRSCDLQNLGALSWNSNIGTGQGLAYVLERAPA